MSRQSLCAILAGHGRLTVCTIIAAPCMVMHDQYSCSGFVVCYAHICLGLRCILPASCGRVPVCFLQGAHVSCKFLQYWPALLAHLGAAVLYHVLVLEDAACCAGNTVVVDVVVLQTMPGCCCCMLRCGVLPCLANVVEWNSCEDLQGVHMSSCCLLMAHPHTLPCVRLAAGL